MPVNNNDTISALTTSIDWNALNDYVTIRPDTDRIAWGRWDTTAASNTSEEALNVHYAYGNQWNVNDTIGTVTSNWNYDDDRIVYRYDGPDPSSEDTIKFPFQYIDEYLNGKLDLDTACDKTIDEMYKIIDDYVLKHKKTEVSV